ncbi:MAG TPA: DoxX family protein [Polyangiales bacterium]|nr:DoxX family protein [Polyangiales bacterium]
MRWFLVIGRLLFGGALIWEAAKSIQEASALTTELTNRSVPYPHAATILSVWLLALGGSSVLLGLAPRMGLGLISLVLVAATPVLHAFWTVADPAARATELSMFLQNVSLLGAALGMMAIPVPWPWSIDEWTSRSGSSPKLFRRFTAGFKDALARVRTRPIIAGHATPQSSLAKSFDGDMANDSYYVTQSWTATSDGEVVIRSRVYGYYQLP